MNNHAQGLSDDEGDMASAMEKLSDDAQSFGGTMNPEKMLGTDSHINGDGELAAAISELATRIEGDVDTSRLVRAQYATDASNYRVPPRVVVFPRHAADVRTILAWAREHRIPVTSRGGGTSTAGNSIGTGVIIEFSRYMNKILDIDPEARTARVQPGVVMSDLQAAAAKYGLRFGPDPSTQNRATFGGMIGNNACGPHAVAYGKTANNVVALECIDGCGREFTASKGALISSRSSLAGSQTQPEMLAQPETLSQPESAMRHGTDMLMEDLRTLTEQNLALIRTECGRFGRQVSGYSLEWLLPESGFDVAKFLVGTEGTLVTITEATLQLVPIAAAPTLVVLGYPDMPTAADAVPALLKHKPLAIEGMDAELVEMVRRHQGSVPELPDGNGWLMVEVGALEGEDPQAVPERARALAADAGTNAVMIKPAGPEATTLWKIRADGAGLGGRTPRGTQAWPGWEDSAVPPEKLGAYLRDLQALMDRHGLSGLMYGHFGDGCVHVRIDFPLDQESGVPIFREFMEQAADVAASFGGSLSGEHGDGRARTELLPRMYSQQLMELFAQVKALFDPDNGLNPGVLAAPSPAPAHGLVKNSAAPSDQLLHRQSSSSAPLYPLDADLRRVSAQSIPYAGGFHFHEHDGDFSKAVHVCTGVGKCRADLSAAGGWMCPSYQATKDEKDVTRGRMRILQEVTQAARTPAGANALLERGFADSAVRAALDLCLACKACSADCPTGADMARFRSEVLYRGYKGKLRPRSHYLLGNLPRLARIVTAIPGLAAIANASLSFPPLRKLAFTLAGLDKRRQMPGFAKKRFSRLPSVRALSSAHAELSSLTASASGSAVPASGGTVPPSPASEAAAPAPSPKQLPEDQAPIPDHASPTSTPTPSLESNHGAENRQRYVMLWADSFSETLDTRGAQAMVQLLQSYGYTVLIPPEDICCGLTWITTGQLDTAKKKLRHLLGVLAPFAASGIPIVGVEPSCTAVLRDDMLDLLPEDKRGKLVNEMTFTLAELLTSEAFEPEKLQLPDLRGIKIITQPHCHHYSVMGWKADEALLRRTGAQLQILTGCCGLAGNFGMERGHYEVSQKVAERQLLPALREDAQHGSKAIYLADGFSCRTQAQQLAGKQGVHLAELLLRGKQAGHAQRAGAQAGRKQRSGRG